MRSSPGLSHSALLVIDMQRYFLLPGASAFLKDAPGIVPNVLKLIEAYRKAALPIAFTRHAHKKNEDAGQMGRWWNMKLPWEGDAESLLIDEIVPQQNEIFMTKSLYSAFEETKLAGQFADLGVETIVICGVMTNLCVETSARHAFMKGFGPVVVKDACAANGRENHLASILNLSYGFAHIEETRHIIDKLKS